MQSSQTCAVALLTATLLGAGSWSMGSAIANPTPPAPGVVGDALPVLPQAVVRRVQQNLAQRLGQPASRFQVVSYNREVWPDGCLGLGAANERCRGETVQGWRIELTNGQRNWVYRTDLKAQVLKLDERATTLPPQVIERLFDAIARNARVPRNTLKIVEFQPQTWNGCMGIFEPGRACTMIAMPGFRVIVAGDRLNWVYHVTQDGSRMVQNATASGSGIRITPSFIPTEGQPPMPGPGIVFRQLVSGGIAGMTTETVLMADGVIYQETTGLQPSMAQKRRVVKRLSQRQLQQFQQVLQQQKLPNLNGMRYLTSAALADYPTTTFQAMGSTVAYIDLEERSLPPALQTILGAWKRLL